MKAFNNYQKLQGIAGTRIRLGFTQEGFAMELGISRSLLSKAESHTRSLPMWALAKLAALEIMLAAAASAAVKNGIRERVQPDSSRAEYEVSRMKYKEMECTMRAERLECKLQLMMACYAQDCRSLDNINLLIKAAEEGTQHFESCHLRMLRYTLETKVRKNGVSAQAAMRHKIALLYTASHLHALAAAGEAGH
jgi:transcriptional regulator with XRE-family HTH domain